MITSKSNPITAVQTGHPILDYTQLRFLIGAAQTSPPSEYFELLGEKTRFMQRVEARDGERVPIQALIPGGPGMSRGTIAKNNDVFIKREPRFALCPACTAAALYAHQFLSPPGGLNNHRSMAAAAIHFTVERSALADTVQANVISADLFRALGNGAVDDELRFPWLAKKHEFKICAPDNCPAEAVYWGMPRLVWLCDDSTRTGTCSLCGKNGDLFTEYHRRPNGLSYRKWVPPFCARPVNNEDFYVLPPPDLDSYPLRLWNFIAPNSAHYVPPLALANARTGDMIRCSSLHLNKGQIIAFHDQRVFYHPSPQLPPIAMYYTAQKLLVAAVGELSKNRIAKHVTQCRFRDELNQLTTEHIRGDGELDNLLLDIFSTASDIYDQFAEPYFHADPKRAANAGNKMRQILHASLATIFKKAEKKKD